MTLSGTFSIVLVVTHIKESKIIWGQLSTNKTFSKRTFKTKFLLTLQKYKNHGIYPATNFN